MANPPSIDAAINKLVELLTLEKSRLLSGSYDGFPEIAQQKEYFLSILTGYIQDPVASKSLKPYAKSIEQIKALANENEALLQAAKNGINAAQTRLQKIMTRESLVGAYTAEGEKLRTHDSVVTRRKFA